MATRRRTTGICTALTAGLLLAGCGQAASPSAARVVAPAPGSGQTTAPGQTTASDLTTPNSAPTPSVTPASADRRAAVAPSASPSSVRRSSAGKTSSTKPASSRSGASASSGQAVVSGSIRTGATATCTNNRSSAWASWPMPNPAVKGLPNHAAYKDLGGGRIKDKVTCLTWQKGFSPTKLTWSQATSYCSGLNLGGRGWRLPSRVELTSIVDFTRSGPALNTSVFQGIANFFWTSSPWAVAHTPKYVWAMNFYEGLATNAGNTAGTYFARCVKGATGTGAATYSAAGTGQRQDKQTGLIWQRATARGGAMSAAAAKSYCANLTLGGHRWRLPSIKELATTVDESRVAPAINRTVFPDTAKASYYWSSSKAAPQPSATWALSYMDGFTNYRNIASAYTRCVR